MGTADLISKPGFHLQQCATTYEQYPSGVLQQPSSSEGHGKRKSGMLEAAGVESSRFGIGVGQKRIIDLTQDSPPRKRRLPGTKKAVNREDNDGDIDTSSKPKQRKAHKPNCEEKRLRRWRTHAPTAYLEVRDRALAQRMVVLDRQRDTSNAEHPTETISLAGTTGNVYTIAIDNVPSCDCPHAAKGNQCKHIAYVLSRVLRVSGELEYQLAFTSAELRAIFARAPPLPCEVAEKDRDHDGNRKVLEGDCPICFMEFEAGEETVYCKAACGNNIHATCFQQWAATKKGGAVSCPFCRTLWHGQTDDDLAKKVAKDGPRNEEGYVNVASQLGLSGRRDYSAYHSYWVRRQAMNGEISWDDDGVILHDRY